MPFTQKLYHEIRQARSMGIQCLSRCPTEPRKSDNGALLTTVPLPTAKKLNDFKEHIKSACKNITQPKQ